MQTDFAAVRQYLEGAWLHIHGDDDDVCQLRNALDRLIETVTIVEHGRPLPAAVTLDFQAPVTTLNGGLES